MSLNAGDQITLTRFMGIHGKESAIFYMPINRQQALMKGPLSLADAIRFLQAMVHINPSAAIYMDDDINDDNTIGIENIILILQIISGLR